MTTAEIVKELNAILGNDNYDTAGWANAVEALAERVEAEGKEELGDAAAIRHLGGVPAAHEATIAYQLDLISEFRERAEKAEGARK